MHRPTYIITACILLLLVTGPALAAGGGHALSDLPWANFFYRIVTVGLFVYVIYYFFGKKIVAFFKGRSEGIAAELTSLEERKAAAQKHLEIAEQRIASLEKEREAILADYRAQGEALKASILAQAEKTAARTAAQAKQTAQNEIDAAVDNMRAQMAEAVASATEKLLKERLYNEEDVGLIEKYVKKVVIN